MKMTVSTAQITLLIVLALDINIHCESIGAISILALYFLPKIVIKNQFHDSIKLTLAENIYLCTKDFMDFKMFFPCDTNIPVEAVIRYSFVSYLKINGIVIESTLKYVYLFKFHQYNHVISPCK